MGRTATALPCLYFYCASCLQGAFSCNGNILLGKINEVGILSKKVSVVMGSDSDLPVIKKCLAMLDKFGVPYEAHVISAHRTPAQAEALAKGAEENGVGVIIAAAGK